MSDQQTVPPPPPAPPGAGDASAEEPLVRRVERLEDGQLDTRERLARLETRLDDIAAQMVTKTEFAVLSARVDAMAAQMATKADIEALRVEIAASANSLLKWFIATAVALSSLAFAAARFIR